METPKYACFFFTGVVVVVNDIMVFSVAMEMQQSSPVALLLSCKIFDTAVNNNNI